MVNTVELVQQESGVGSSSEFTGHDTTQQQLPDQDKQKTQDNGIEERVGKNCLISQEIDVEDVNDGNTLSLRVSTIEDPAVLEALSVDRRVVSQTQTGVMPQALVAEAEGDLHEKEDWVDRDILALKEMVEVEEDLNSRIDKPFLLSFLRARKFDYDKALSMIRGYYSARQENADMYVDLNPTSLDSVWAMKMQTVLPTPDKLGRTVLIFNTSAWLPEQCSLDDVFRCQVILLEHIVRLPVTQLRGIAAVVDCAGLSTNQAYYLTPTHIKRMISIIQEVFPLRFKALHFVNEPNIFDWIFSFVRPFLSETLQGRLHFHGDNLASLYEHIPQESLPEELGGSQGPLDNSALVNNLKHHEEYFKDNFSYGYLPVEEPVTTVAQSSSSMLDAVSGMGSFIGSYYRRMCID